MDDAALNLHDLLKEKKEDCKIFFALQKSAASDLAYFASVVKNGDQKRFYRLSFGWRQWLYTHYPQNFFFNIINVSSRSHPSCILHDSMG